jgi:hypothetical protein
LIVTTRNIAERVRAATTGCEITDGTLKSMEDPLKSNRSKSHRPLL